jgi:hypothetical protein
MVWLISGKPEISGLLRARLRGDADMIRTSKSLHS